MRLAMATGIALATALLGGCDGDATATSNFGRELVYHVTFNLPRDATIEVGSDVRIGDESVGEVSKVGKSPRGSVVTLSLDPEFAPISSDAEAILRQKTLLGETYVELTTGEPGSEPGPATGGESLPEDANLGDNRRRDPTTLDEIFRSFDQETQREYREHLRKRGRELTP